MDAGGKLLDGREFRGSDEFKRLLIGDRDRFAEAFIEQITMYVLQRVMTIDDADLITAIPALCKNGVYKLRTILQTFIASELFLKR